MSFRDENPKYRELREKFKTVFYRAVIPGKGTRIDEVDNLMLASYSLMRCIREYLRGEKVTAPSTIRVPLLPEAAKDMRYILELKPSTVLSLYHEAEKLEALSRAAYRWLKDNDKLV